MHVLTFLKYVVITRIHSNFNVILNLYCMHDENLPQDVVQCKILNFSSTKSHFRFVTKEKLLFLNL